MDISVVCPFYNEAEIIESAVEKLLAQLSSLDAEWELIIVNDGSTDGSEAIAQRLALRDSRLRALGYRFNRGRGYALRTGIAAARGEIIVTTEIDLSWGERIVHDLFDAMRSWPDVDMVVASPHLEGAGPSGYRNVPFKRVWLSRLGNRVIRACMFNGVTMNTGMTRAYRHQAIQSLPLLEDGKEFHLEVILKAAAFGLRIREIPAVLEWKEYKHHGKRVKRKSSSRVNRLIVSHSLFSVFANPVRYVWAMSFTSLGLGAAFLIFAALLFYWRMVSAYTALLSLSLLILGIVLFVLGVVVKQGNMIQRELWVLQSHQFNHHGFDGTCKQGGGGEGAHFFSKHYR
ncbi:MAG: Undecaprenyl-phosphate 4-deoxy-4-formamido-L-arabinose transferase [Acidobacteria bacterium]|nr:Undecaprenyl-phosphate 4-deoxy-4-formamido-L-arabinose transferase [Acidobacteriota bacterium]